MAKKAPAKRKPNELEANRENYSRLAGKLKDATPPKRKPRAKKPAVKPVLPDGQYNSVVWNQELNTYEVRPNKPADGFELSDFSEETKDRLREILDRKDIEAAVAASIPQWLANTFTAGVLLLIVAAIFGAGVGTGIWYCGGIPIGPDNKPVPTPVPEPVKSFRVIFVKESGQTLPGEQAAIPGAKEIRDYVNAKTTGEGGQPGWREFDPQQQTANEQPTMQKLWEAVKPQLLPAPCLVVEVNGKVTVMPFPRTVAEAVETLKKAGG